MPAPTQPSARSLERAGGHVMRRVHPNLLTAFVIFHLSERHHLCIYQGDVEGSLVAQDDFVRELAREFDAVRAEALETGATVFAAEAE